MQLRHGKTVRGRGRYYRQERQRRRGRRRGTGRRGKEGAGFLSALSLLGVVAEASPALVEAVMLECLRDSYGEACGALALRGVEMSEKRVRSIAVALGREALADRERTVAGGEATGEAVGKRIVVAMDGGRVLIRTDRRGRKTLAGRHAYSADWREPKLFIIYEIDEKGRKKRKGLVRCDGTIGNPDDIIRLLVSELKRMNAGAAVSLAFLGDGAKWIWNRLDAIVAEAGIAPARVTRCLDYYHAVEHLAAVADAISFGSESERRGWLDRMKRLLKKARPADFLAELGRSRRRGNAVIRREYSYFKTNIASIDYAALLARKLPIGSGAIESAVRRVVNLRLKGAGTFWKLENAETMLHLRCQLKTHNWSSFYKRLLERMAG